jgi:hypothetical protein
MRIQGNPHSAPQAYLMESNMPDYGFGGCDGHHEIDDFRLREMSASP